MKKSKKKKRTVTIIFVILVILVISGFFLSGLWDYYAQINQSEDYKIYVKSSVINILNNEYSQDTENIYCVDGILDTSNKKITITDISLVPTQKVIYKGELYAKSLILQPCSGKLGKVHTHPKLMGIVPKCSFSNVDFFDLGVSSIDEGLLLGGVYCDKDKIAFYLTGSYETGSLFLTNNRIGYTLIP